MSLHRYGYVNNNPINYFDQDGFVVLPIYVNPVNQTDCEKLLLDPRLKKISNAIIGASKQFDIPEELIAAVLETENHSKASVSTLAQDMDREASKILSESFWDYNDGKPKKDGWSFGIANIKPGTAITIRNRIKYYTPDMMKGVEWMDFDSKEDIINAIDDDEKAVYLLAAELRGWLSILEGADDKKTFDGKKLPPFSSSGSELTDEQMAWLGQRHNAQKNYNVTWAEKEIQDLLKNYRSGAKPLKFLPPYCTDSDDGSMAYEVNMKKMYY